MIPETDFPDIRNRCAIHSNNGSCMIIPREGDKVRLYVQVTANDVVDPETGRIDKSRIGPERLVQVAKKTFFPYSMHADQFDWWTIYISGFIPGVYRVNGRVLKDTISRAARRIKVFSEREGVHCRRCLPYAFAQSWAGHECEYERYSQPRCVTTHSVNVVS